MDKEQKKQWLSAYLYYNEADPDEILVSFVFDYILKRKYDLSKYFFIRYSDGYGRHIRLRLLVHEQDLHLIKKDIEKEYKRFYLSVQPEHGLPDNLIRYEDYIPETDRYGGNSGIPIAEDYFCSSSVIILEISKEIGLDDYSTRIALVLQLHLITLFALSDHKDVLTGMLSSIQEDWLHAGFSKLPQVKNSPSMNFSEKCSRCIESYSAAYNRDKGGVYLLLEDLFKNLNLNRDLEDDKLNNWLESNKIFRNRFNLIIEDNSDANYSLTPDYTLKIYKSLIHMNNNRVGIYNRDEGYIAFILIRFLEENW